MFKLLFAWARGGKTNTAMIGLAIVFALNKYFGVAASETEVEATILVILGAVGQIHRAIKQGWVQKAIAAIKAKNEPKKDEPKA